MTDYEVALRNAIAKVIPGAQLTACWFHYCQAIKRNLMKFPKIIETILKDDNAKRLYYMLICLPLLPAENILKEFDSIKQRLVEIYPLMFDKFLAYFEKQWLIKVF